MRTEVAYFFVDVTQVVSLKALLPHAKRDEVCRRDLNFEFYSENKRLEKLCGGKMKSC